MSEPRIVTAGVIIIGNEILSGRTQDTNLNFLARELSSIGVRLMEARVVPDIEAEIVGAVNAMRGRYDLVFTTGGIGPTHDDITSASIAKAFGVNLVRNPDAVALLTQHYGTENLTDARLRMADIPQGAMLIDNPISTAPGFRLENVHVLAGVPSICRAMFDGLRGNLRGGDIVRSVTISAFIGEGVIAKDLGALQSRHPNVDIGSYPFFRQGRFGAVFVVRGTDWEALRMVGEELRGIIRALGAEPLDGEPAEREAS